MSGVYGKLLTYGTAPARPHTGEAFAVLNRDSFNNTVTGGQFEVVVTALHGRTLKRQKGPLCGADTSFDVSLGPIKVAEITYHGLRCPLVAGPTDVTYDIKLSKILPPAFGSASFNITAQDEQGRQLLCIQAHLGIWLEDENTALAASNHSTVIV